MITISRSLQPHLQRWLQEERLETTPTQPYSSDLYRCLKKRLEHSLRRSHKRDLRPLPESNLHINYLELNVVFLALKEFQDLCTDIFVLIAKNNTTVVTYINMEGDMRSGSLCALLWRILTWCSKKQVTQGPTHSRLAECGCRQAIQTRPDRPNRVSSPSRGLPVDLHQVDQPQLNRPICIEVQQHVI